MGLPATAPFCLSCCAEVIRITSNSRGLCPQLSTLAACILLTTYARTLYLYICISAGDSRTSRFEGDLPSLPRYRRWRCSGLHLPWQGVCQCLCCAKLWHKLLQFHEAEENNVCLPREDKGRGVSEHFKGVVLLKGRSLPALTATQSKMPFMLRHCSDDCDRRNCHAE